MPTISRIFVDTNIFVATRDENDSTYQRASKLLNYLKNSPVQLYTSSDVIGETLTVMTKKLGKTVALNWFKDFQASDTKEIFISEEIHEKARKLFLEVKSKNVSFIDCSSVISMKHAKIPLVFTFDQHFKTLGVKLLEETKHRKK